MKNRIEVPKLKRIVPTKMTLEELMSYMEYIIEIGQGSDRFYYDLINEIKEKEENKPNI